MVSKNGLLVSRRFPGTAELQTPVQLALCYDSCMPVHAFSLSSGLMGQLALDGHVGSKRSPTMNTGIWERPGMLPCS